MQGLEQIIELIKENQGIAEFANFGDGASDEWITKAEEAIGCPLPDSYKWWFAKYGGGEIGGEEIFSVYEEDFDEVVGGDVVYMYRLDAEENKRKYRIPICHSDVDGVFAFNVQQGVSNNEYSVVSEATGTKYAENFLDFLVKRIACFKERRGLCPSPLS